MCQKPRWDPLPKVNYGQGSGAFNPTKRDPVYQQVEKARGNAGFALDFATDIALGKHQEYYQSGRKYTSPGAFGRRGREIEGQGGRVMTAGLERRSVDPEAEHALNPYGSWVSKAFSSPVMKKGNSWYNAMSHTAQRVVFNPDEEKLKGLGRVAREEELARQRKEHSKIALGGRSFLSTNKITDQDLVRKLEDGHYAFSAKGFDGVEVYIPFARGYELTKSESGAPETGNRKADRGEASKDRTVGMVGGEMSDLVMGGQKSILGKDAKKRQGKTLLG